jgi:GrpB-like predicted nucleotidyltransferase (UPF0157 family)
MKKSLSEMSLEELWQLFPIILKPHNPDYSSWYQKEKEIILNAVRGLPVTRIEHIGSTAVPGLIAKPIVDILLEVSASCDLCKMKDRLTSAGWILMAEVMEPEMKVSFNKGYTPDGFAEKVFHLHVRFSGDWDELYFRDYLIAHPETAAEYENLKQSLLIQFEHDRDAYTQAKAQFVRDVSQKGRAEGVDRYKPADNF